MSKNLPNRRPLITVNLPEGLVVSVGFHPATLEPVEVFMTKSGQKASDAPMNNALYELGVVVSKLMQEGYNVANN